MYQINAEYDARPGSVSGMKFASGQVESKIYNSCKYHIVL